MTTTPVRDHISSIESSTDSSRTAAARACGCRYRVRADR
jgi:hypothetical protein